jgi:hypothetical protein
MTVRKKVSTKTDDFLTTAAKALGGALGNLVVRSGLSKPDAPAKAPARKKRAQSQVKATAKKTVTRKVVGKRRRADG